MGELIINVLGKTNRGKKKIKEVETTFKAYMRKGLAKSSFSKKELIELFGNTGKYISLSFDNKKAL